MLGVGMRRPCSSACLQDRARRSVKPTPAPWVPVIQEEVGKDRSKREFALPMTLQALSSKED